MPVLRSGTFVLYGVTLANPDTLTDGALLAPPDPANWYLVDTGPATPIPCAPQWSPPTLLDTTTEGNGFAAGEPPPGFVPRFVGLGVCPVAHMGLGSSLLADLNGANVGNYWSMAGSGNVAISGATPPEAIPIFHGPGLDSYADLLGFLELHVVDLHTVFFPHAIWPIVGGISTPTVGPRVTGGYDIVAFWWTLPPTAAIQGAVPAGAIDGVNVTFTTVGVYEGLRVYKNGAPLTRGDDTDPGDYTETGPDTFALVVAPTALDVVTYDACSSRQPSQLQLSAEDPGAPWERLDPLDPDAAPAPTITSITPTHGGLAGGTVLEIVGSGFGAGCTVTVDGLAATPVSVVSQFLIRCPTPAHAAGLVDVVVTNADGVSS